MLIMLADEANVNIQNMIHNWPYHGGLTEPDGALRSKMLIRLLEGQFRMERYQRFKGDQCYETMPRSH